MLLRAIEEIVDHEEIRWLSTTRFIHVLLIAANDRKRVARFPLDFKEQHNFELEDFIANPFLVEVLEISPEDFCEMRFVIERCTRTLVFEQPELLL